MSAAPAGGSVAYLSSRYPEPSWTAVDREVDALRELGWDVVTLSVRNPLPEVRGVPALRARAMTTDILRAGGFRALLGRLSMFAARRPAAFLRATGRALRTGARSPGARLGQLVRLAEAVTLLAVLDQDDVRHVHVHVADAAADTARAVVALGNDRDGGGWTWSLAVHGPTELADPVRHDVVAKAASATLVVCPTRETLDGLAGLLPAAEHTKLRTFGVDPGTDPDGGTVVELAALLTTAGAGGPGAGTEDRIGDVSVGHEIDVRTSWPGAPVAARWSTAPRPPGDDAGGPTDADEAAPTDTDDVAALAVPRPRSPASQGTAH